MTLREENEQYLKLYEEDCGKKIASSHFIKIFISDKYLGGGGAPDFPYQSVKLDDEKLKQRMLGLILMSAKVR